MAGRCGLAAVLAEVSARATPPLKRPSAGSKRAEGTDAAGGVSGGETVGACAGVGEQTVVGRRDQAHEAVQ